MLNSDTLFRLIRENPMKIKIKYLILILPFLTSCVQEKKKMNTWNKRISEYEPGRKSNVEKEKTELRNQKIAADTIINW